MRGEVTCEKCGQPAEVLRPLDEPPVPFCVECISLHVGQGERSRDCVRPIRFWYSTTRIMRDTLRPRIHAAMFSRDTGIREFTERERNGEVIDSQGLERVLSDPVCTVCQANKALFYCMCTDILTLLCRNCFQEHSIRYIERGACFGMIDELKKQRLRPEGTLKPEVGSPNIGCEVNSLATPVVKKFTETAPTYRTIPRGLSFKSKCMHPDCAAYNHTVYVKKGLGHFNIGVESETLKCPQCGNKVGRSTNCGFYLAQWKFTGVTKKGNEIVVEGKTETRDYYTWADEEDTTWVSLEVQVDAYRP